MRRPLQNTSEVFYYQRLEKKEYYFSFPFLSYDLKQNAPAKVLCFVLNGVRGREAFLEKANEQDPALLYSKKKKFSRIYQVKKLTKKAIFFAISLF
ncbi:UNVERIFIED_CONTAM: hypothetical protein O8I53_13835 [Campylobacter lari]|nr:hypothetical protein [Campylobacter lari]